MTTPTSQQPYTSAPAPSPKNRAGLVALILGIVAVIFAIIPFLSYIAWAVGIAAVIVGIVGAVKAVGRKGGAITGIVLGVVAVILSIVMSIVYTAAFFVAAASDAIASSSAAAPVETTAPSEAPSGDSADATSKPTGSRTVTYTVTGDGKATNISYFTVNGGSAGQEQVTDENLPWKKVVKITDDTLFQASVFSLVAQNSGSGKITCEISADGKVLSKHTSSGQYSVVTCSGSAG